VITGNCIGPAWKGKPHGVIVITARGSKNRIS